MAKILYIDERPERRAAMQARFLGAGYEVLVAENGPSGLTAARRGKPNLVLCQSDLTEMPALEVMQSLRDASRECEATLFILLAQKQDQDRRQQYLDQGVDDSLPGDVDFELLNRELAARLGIVERQTRRREHELIKLYSALSRQTGAGENTGISAAGQKPALPDRESFASLASQRLKAAQEAGAEAHLTLIEVPGLDALSSAGDDATASKLRAEIESLLLSQASDGVGQLDTDRFGLIQEEAADNQALQNSINQLINENGLEEKGVGAIIAPVALSSNGLSPEESARALVYAVNRFADRGGVNFNITSLQESLSACIEDTVARITNLRGDINGRRVELNYQPIVDLQTRAPHHYEALARFADGASPYEMIVFAEQIGLAHELDFAICQKIIEFVNLNSLEPMPVDVAMNLSAGSLESSIFISVMRQMFAKLGENRKRVLLEITESARIKDYDVVARTIQRLRKDGFRICLDDFGAGESNFNYLRMFEVEYVKIDGIYVRDVLRSQRDQAFIRAIASLCKEIGVRTVAEFVEEEKQAKSLKNLGVDLGQGYLFGKPAPSPRQ